MDRLLGGFEIDGIVILEFESKFEFWINGGTNVGGMIEHIEGLIRMSLSVVDILCELFFVSVSIDTRLVSFVIDLSMLSAIASFVGSIPCLPTCGIWSKGDMCASSLVCLDV